MTTKVTTKVTTKGEDHIRVGVFDLETTGLWDAAKPVHKIIELAIVTLVFDREGRELSHLMAQASRRINPERPIDAKAFEVHGIRYEDVAHEPTFRQVAPHLKRVFAEYDFVVAHNGTDFDYPFLMHEFQQAGVTDLAYPPLVDSLLESRWATPFGKLPSLKELAFACRVEYDEREAHGALYDAMVLAKCYLHGRQRGLFSFPARRASTSFTRTPEHVLG